MHRLLFFCFNLYISYKFLVNLLIKATLGKELKCCYNFGLGICKDYSLGTTGLNKFNFGDKVNINFIYLHKGNIYF